jgi:hypothetical protein
LVLPLALALLLAATQGTHSSARAAAQGLVTMVGKQDRLQPRRAQTQVRVWMP